MSSILLVTSSPRGPASHSSRIAGELVRSLQERAPGSRLVGRDRAAAPLPHIGGDFALGSRTAPEDRSAAQAATVAVSDAAVDELLAR